MKAEMPSPVTTPAKKPIVLKKPTPTRKKLQSTLSQMLDEDPMEDVHPAPVIKRSKSRSKSGEVLAWRRYLGLTKDVLVG